MVSSGSYSDYQVCCVFSTEEKAKAWADRHNGPERQDCYFVEEMGFDEPVPEGLGSFHATFEDGEHLFQFGPRTETQVYWDPDGPPHSPATVRREEKVITRPNGETCVLFRGLKYEAWGETREHARRSVDELRRAVKAGTYIVPETP